MNLYQKINEVRKKVTYVQKDAKVSTYKAVSHDQVTAVLRAALVDQGIIITQSIINSSFEETGSTTGNGTKWMIYTARYEITFINSDEPNEKFTINSEAQALDFGDKASGKAMSYSMKYALLKTFNLETGENEEGRQDDLKAAQDGRESITAENVATLNDLIAETNSDKDKFMSFFKVSSIESLKANQYNHALNALKTKLGSE